MDRCESPRLLGLLHPLHSPGLLYKQEGTSNSLPTG